MQIRIALCLINQMHVSLRTLWLIQEELTIFINLDLFNIKWFMAVADPGEGGGAMGHRLS